jgi:hypothetical protein
MVTRILRDDPGKSTMHNVSPMQSYASCLRLLMSSNSDKQSASVFCGKVSQTTICEKLTNSEFRACY